MTTGNAIAQRFDALGLALGTSQGAALGDALGAAALGPTLGEELGMALGDALGPATPSGYSKDWSGKTYFELIVTNTCVFIYECKKGCF
jgi:hypothetical protein